MKSVEDTLHIFGRALGMPALALGPDNTLALGFERSGDLFIEAREDSILVYLARDCRHREGVWLAALRLCHYQTGWPFPVQAAMGPEETLIFAIRLEVQAFTPPALEQAVQLLIRLQDLALEGK
ncbi:MAG: type III secretion chaperone SycN [Pseudomonadota bacterium]